MHQGKRGHVMCIRTQCLYDYLLSYISVVCSASGIDSITSHVNVCQGTVPL